MAIGFQSTRETLYLAKGADFIHVLSAPSGTPYPSGFTAKIEILSSSGTVLATWTPTTATTTAVSWNVQSGTATVGVDAVLAAGANKFKLYAIFPGSPTDDYLWYSGRISATT